MCGSVSLSLIVLLVLISVALDHPGPGASDRAGIELMDHGNDSFRKEWLVDERLGLFSAADFRLVTGECVDCSSAPAALWYFRGELIAVPRSDLPVTGTATSEPVALPFPVLVWIGSPEVVGGATLSEDGSRLREAGRTLALALVPKLPTNRSFVDDSTMKFFGGRPLRLRGTTRVEDGAPTFVARTIWPEDSRIDFQALRLEPLADWQAVTDLVRAQVAGAETPFLPRLLWERDSGQPRRWGGRPVLALVLSGAQGDDDGAHAGHLAVATGVFGPRGEWADWMVNNFYPLDEESEKGILAAAVPMDNYLTDLNSGQALYRPNYLLVAVLRADGAARRAQAALQDTLYRFYCHDLVFEHGSQNSTELSVETLRGIGWQIPRMGPTSYLKGLAAFVYASLRERSLSGGKRAFAYLAEERTHLFPGVAFEAAAEDLLRIVGARAGLARALAPYERMLRDDVEAVLFVRFPQIPSARAFGTYPVGSIDEYRARVPSDRSRWHTATLPPRPFPAHLRDTCRSRSAARDARYPTVVSTGVSRRLRGKAQPTTTDRSEA
jgi:hypothetical protein